MTDYSGTISVPTTGYYLDEWAVRTQERRKSDNAILPSNSTTPASDGTYTLTSPDIYDRYVKLIPEQPKGSDWQASTAYSLGDYVHPTTFAGYVFRCTTAGTSGGTEPTWDETHGNTTSDNTVTWTAIAYLGEAAGEGKFWQGEYDVTTDIVASLFGSSEAGVIYDPSDLSALFQDDAGTAPVSDDGDPVGRMEDKSGNGFHATQATGARKPIYRTDGTLRWIEFDGVDHYLEISSSLDIGTSALSVVIGAGNTDVADEKLISIGNQSTSGGDWEVTAEYGVRVIGGNWIANEAPKAPPAVVTTLFAGGDVVNLDMRRNGVALTESSSSSQTVDLNPGGIIGARTDGSTPNAFANMDFYGCIVVNVELSGEKLTEAESWVSDRLNGGTG